jgi:hypothetical protein
MLTTHAYIGMSVPVVVVLEVGEVGNIGDRAVPDEEGALPVQVLHVGVHLAGLQRPPCELLKLVLPAASVLRLGQPLHLVHQFGRNAMVQHLQQEDADAPDHSVKWWIVY